MTTWPVCKQLEHYIKHTDVEMVQRLVAAGANDNMRGALRFAISTGHCEVVRLIADSEITLRHGWGGALLAAVKGGDRPVVQLLLQYGIEYNRLDVLFEKGQLIKATMDSKVGIMQDLLEAGADPNAWFGRKDGTALHVSCGMPGEVMECLLKAGADIEAVQDYERKPMHVAAIGGYVASINMLYDHGADIESQTEDGGTALHEAAFWSRPHAVKALAEKGANVNARMDRGETPLHVAARMTGFSCERPELIATRDVMDALLLAGADETLVDNRGLAPRHVVGQWDIRQHGWGQREAPEWRMVVRMFYDKLKAVPADRAWRRRGLLVLFRTKEAGSRGVPTASAWVGRSGWEAAMGWVVSQEGASDDMFKIIVSFL